MSGARVFRLTIPDLTKEREKNVQLQTPSPRHDALTTPDADNHTDSEQDASSALQAVLDAITNGELDEEPVSQETLSRLSVARLSLTANTLTSNVFTGETLGVHELNVLYTYKKRLRLKYLEERLLFRTITLKADNNPGWYWFRNLTAEKLAQLLFATASTDSDGSVRLGALALLTDAEIPLPHSYQEIILAVLMQPIR